MLSSILLLSDIHTLNKARIYQFFNPSFLRLTVRKPSLVSQRLIFTWPFPLFLCRSHLCVCFFLCPEAPDALAP